MIGNMLFFGISCSKPNYYVTHASPQAEKFKGLEPFFTFISQIILLTVWKKPCWMILKWFLRNIKSNIRKKVSVYTVNLSLRKTKGTLKQIIVLTLKMLNILIKFSAYIKVNKNIKKVIKIWTYVARTTVLSAELA